MAERFVIPDDLAPAAAREGRDDWLAELPALVARIAADWQIEIGDPFLPGDVYKRQVQDGLNASGYRRAPQPGGLSSYGE